MKTNLLLTLLASSLLAACSSMTPYRPATTPEKTEFYKTHLDVYPGDVRKMPSDYATTHVAWAGIIVSNEATEEDWNNKIRMETIFEQHYFDWEQNRQDGGVRLLISPRGEGRFRVRWKMNRVEQDASYADAMNYAAPGKLAIVYGTPESVDADGTIVLRYHYLRLLGPKEFRTNELDYGRRGEPYRAFKVKADAAAPPPSR